VTEDSEEVVVPKVDSKHRVESDPGVDKERMRINMPSASNPAHMKLRWFTQRL
jgi:hypothetical protein